MTRAALAAGLVLCFAVGAGAQEPPPRPIAGSAERIGRELWSGEPGPPIFHSGVTVDVIPWPASPWSEAGRHPPPRPRGGTITHHTYLTMTTPPAFRGSALFFVGVTTDPGKLMADIRKRRDARQAARVRERIARELSALEPRPRPR